jgi:hypothetical protein
VPKKSAQIPQAAYAGITTLDPKPQITSTASAKIATLKKFFKEIFFMIIDWLKNKTIY